MKCLICKKEMMEDDKLFMIALEVPYMNINVHDACRRITDIPNLMNLVENTLKNHEERYNYYVEKPKRGRPKTRR